MTDDRFRSFNDFWPFYVQEHGLALTRNIHFVGTAISLVFVFLTLFYSPYFIFLALVAGYGFAWPAHFFVEKNRPATFKHPFWSLMADYKMFYLMCLGKMQNEVNQHTR